MSQKKRHLSIRQQRNMQHHRAKKTQNLLNDLEQFVSAHAGELEIKRGIVISRYGKQADVMPLLQDDKFSDDSIRCFMKASLDTLVVGDYVFYQEISQESNQDTYFIIDIAPRTNLITRYYFNKARNIVANVTTMIITSSINPTFNTEIIDRYLIVAENSGITPLIIINKVDLCSPTQEQQVSEAVATYTALGYNILPVSATTGLNIAVITATLDKPGLHIFVGQTGVGKSSLINAIFGRELMAVGEINQNTKLGKHTTTTSKLFCVNDHAALIDSPGIREFSMENYSSSQIIKGYRELQDPAYTCRFSDCNHVNNDGCGIAQCYADGKFAEFRYQNLMNLLTLAMEQEAT